MSNVKIMPATEAMLTDFYGEKPTKTVRALMGIVNGKPLGLGGYYIDTARVVMFSDISEEGMRYKKTIFTIAKRMLVHARATGLPIWVTPDKKHSDATRMLERLGFKKLNEEVWIWQE